MFLKKKQWKNKKRIIGCFEKNGGKLRKLSLLPFLRMV